MLISIYKNFFGLQDIRSKGGFRVGRGGRAPSPPSTPLFFAITCVFCNHFEELQTVLIEVELVINNAPLTYFYPNTIET